MRVVPAYNLTISTGSEYEFWICFTPIHSVDTLRVALVNDYHWSLLVSQIPNLQFIALLVVESHCNLCGNALTPANHHITVATSSCITSEVEDRIITLDVPKGYQTIFRGRGQDMANLSVPRYGCYVGSCMRIFLARLAEVGISGVLVSK